MQPRIPSSPSGRRTYTTWIHNPHSLGNWIQTTKVSSSRTTAWRNQTWNPSWWTLDIQTRILTAFRQSHAINQQMVQLLDSKIRSLYTEACGLVNDRAETLRGYGRVQTALEVHQQSILRKCGLFVKPTSFQVAAPKSKDMASTATMSSAANAAKKRRSRGKGRKIRNISPHTTPPPIYAPPRTSTPVPAARPVFSFTDARPQYRQTACSGQPKQKSGSGTPCSPSREKQRVLPPRPAGLHCWDTLAISLGGV